MNKEKIKKTIFHFFLVTFLGLYFIVEIESFNFFYIAFTEDLLPVLKGSQSFLNNRKAILILISYQIPLVLFFLFLYKKRKNKKVFKGYSLLFLLFLLVVFPIFMFNFQSLSLKKLKYNLDFYKQNERRMTDEENVMYIKSGNAYLANNDYCKKIGGLWIDKIEWYLPSYEVCIPFKSCTRMSYCVPPTSDGGKKCYDDSECESYCNVKSKNATYGTCDNYQRERYECSSYLYFENGEVKRTPPIWC